ncbi:tripartite tricarboxylate transporter substrate binding protein [Parapusillimonas granuli]|uniref:Tripartite tricarboxylate transporter substrate binding protein n=2 Tax=Parapusillimonas granuli TaxID=380911 RepID=A0A853FYN3_9BURK|nr:tripartite tricarboxylate transporter substrate binding protein [Parapusillimonas granuli]
MAIAALTITTLAYAQTFPSRPVKIIVPYPPGGITDIVGRTIAEGLSQELGQPVVVDNRVGASGVIGAVAAARANPDGYTLFVGTSTTNGTNPSTQQSLQYDPAKDFEPVALLAASPFMMIVNDKVPARTVSEFVKYAKGRPDKVFYGTPGAGGSIHLSTELFSLEAGIEMVHVPYKGSSPALTDLLGGSLQVMLDNMPSAVSLMQAGKVRALAVTGKARSPLAPDVPTLKEAGYPNFDSESWLALYAPADTPEAVINTLNAAVNKSLKRPSLLEVFNKVGLVTYGGTPGELASYQAAEIEKWAKVVKAINYEAK